MRVGVLARGEIGQLDWAQRLGFRSIEWVRFDASLAGPQHVEWKPYAEQILAEARARDLRVSAIGALYGNPLDPPQTDFARATFRRPRAISPRRSASMFPSIASRIRFRA